jgi:hypothetical protein
MRVHGTFFEASEPYRPMSHPLLIGLFDTPAVAANAARGLRTLGISAGNVSIVAPTHDEEGAIASVADASPGSELEDSRMAARLGELTAHLLAAVALVVPGIGPIVADGPLAAGLGEAAGHLAGGLARTLERAGVAHADAALLEARVKAGAVLIGAHVREPMVEAVSEVLWQAGATQVTRAEWSEAGK